MAGWFPLFASAAVSGFNSGRSQVNLNAVQTGGDYAFLNQVLNSGYPSLGDGKGSPSPLDVTSKGYLVPNSDAHLNHSGVKWIGFISDKISTIYALQITGKGRVFGIGNVQTIAITAIAGAASTATVNFGTTHNFTVGMEAPISGVSGTIAATLNGNKYVVASIATNSITITVAGTNGLSGTGGTAAYGDLACGVATGGRVIVDCSNIPIEGGYQVNYWIIDTDATTPISKLALLLLGSEETRYNSGEIFGADFLAKLSQGKFGVCRHLNTLNTNSSNTVFWADRCPTDYVNYGGTRFNSSIYTTLTGSGNDYTGSIGIGSLNYGQQVTVQFPAQSATGVTIGAAGVITTSGAHNILVGDVFNVFADPASSTNVGGVIYVPGNIPAFDGPNSLGFGGATVNLYALTTPTASTLTFSLTPGGSAFTTSGSAGTFYLHKTTTDTNVSFSGTTVTLTDPQNLSINDPVSFGSRGGALPTNINGNSGIYYVKTAPSTTSMTISATPGGAAITFTGSPAGTLFMCRLPTINLDSLGAKPILAADGGALSKAGNSIPRARGFGTTLIYGTATYDSVLGAWLLFGGTDGWSTQGIGTSEWPPELTLSLAVKDRHHPWIPAPSYVLDPVTDYMPSLAKYYKDNKPAWMIPRYEIQNEQAFNAFLGAALSKKHADYYKFDAAVGWAAGSNGTDEIAGKMGACLGQAISQVCGGVGNGYEMGIGVQSATMDSSGAAASHDSRFTATEYVSQLSAAQSALVGSWGTITFTKAAAYSSTTYVAAANYIRPYHESIPVAESTLATNFAGVRCTASASGTTLSVSATWFGTLASGMTVFGNGIPANTTISGSAPNWTLSNNVGTLSSRTFWAGNWTYAQSYIDAYSAAITTYNLAYLTNIFGVISTWAKQTGWKDSTGATKKAYCYEGGLSADFTGSGQYSDSQVNILRLAHLFVTSSTNFAQGARTVLEQNYAIVTGAGFLFPSCFIFTGPLPVSGIWSVLVDIYQTPSPPQWDAIVAFNN